MGRWEKKGNMKESEREREEPRKILTRSMKNELIDSKLTLAMTRC